MTNPVFLVLARVRLSSCKQWLQRAYNIVTMALKRNDLEPTSHVSVPSRPCWSTIACAWRFFGLENAGSRCGTNIGKRVAASSLPPQQTHHQNLCSLEIIASWKGRRRHWAPGQQDWKTASLHNAWLLAASDHWGMNQKCYDLNLRMQCTWRSLLGTICGLDQTYQILILTWIFWTLHTLSGRLWSSAWGKKRIPRVPVICCNFKCLSLLFEKAT